MNNFIKINGDVINKNSVRKITVEDQQLIYGLDDSGIKKYSLNSKVKIYFTDTKLPSLTIKDFHQSGENNCLDTICKIREELSQKAKLYMEDVEKYLDIDYMR